MKFDPSKISFTEVHKLMIGSIVPRPIAFVSTLSKNGKNNIAPFSYFNGVCSRPPTIMFAPARRGWDGKEKDTLINIRDNNQFVINIVSESFAEQMVMCSTDFDSDVDEFEISGLNPEPSNKVSPPNVVSILDSKAFLNFFPIIFNLDKSKFLIAIKLGKRLLTFTLAFVTSSTFLSFFIFV